MDQNPYHYDGRYHTSESNAEGQDLSSSTVITDEARKNLSANPYSTEITE